VEFEALGRTPSKIRIAVEMKAKKPQISLRIDFYCLFFKHNQNSASACLLKPDGLLVGKSRDIVGAVGSLLGAAERARLLNLKFCCSTRGVPLLAESSTS